MFLMRSLRSWRGPVALAGAGAVGFVLGAWNADPTPAFAQSPGGPVIPAAGTTSDYSQRVVAYIHGNVPITREDLGEYLIARQAYSKVELLVNRRIIEFAAKKRGITVTDAEVDAAFEEDVQRNKALTVDRETFIKELLKRRGQTLYEFKEDVVRPTLMLKRMCEGEVKVTDAELKKAFDAKYGEKVQCRLIVWEDHQLKNVQSHVWAAIRNDKDEFLRVATQQADPKLASVGGLVDPIGHGASDNTLIEEIAFRLKPGEVSEIFPIKEIHGIGVLRCEGKVAPAAGVTLEQKREELQKPIFERKILQAVSQKFLQLRAEAKPEILIPHRANNVGSPTPSVDDKTVVPLPNQPQKPTK